MNEGARIENERISQWHADGQRAAIAQKLDRVIGLLEARPRSDGRAGSYHFVVEGGRIEQHGLTFCPDFLTIQMTDREAMLLIETLAYKLARSQPIELVYRGELSDKAMGQ